MGSSDYQRRRDAGICHCSQKVSPGHTLCDKHLRDMRERVAEKRRESREAWLKNGGRALLSEVKRVYEGGASKEQIVQDMDLPEGKINWLLHLSGAQKPPKAPAPHKPTLYDRIFEFLAENPCSDLEAVTCGIGHPNRKSVKEIMSRAKRMGYLVLVGRLWRMANRQAA